MSTRAAGMTLVEIMIALAIASLMTLTGWRAVDALQHARDRVIDEARQWQQLDDLFVTLEADLRRASISEFSGSGDNLVMLQPALDGSADIQVVRYQLVPVAFVDGTAGTQVLRTAGTTTTPMADLRSVALAYSQDGVTFDFGAATYPRALRVSVQPLGTAGPVDRLLALR